MSQPLSLTISESQNLPSHILSAYSKILRLEKAPDYSRSKHEVREEKLIHARTLGYLIREGPSTQAKDRVAQEVNSCRNDKEMDKLGERTMPTTSALRTILCEPSRSHSDTKRNVRATFIYSQL